MPEAYYLFEMPAADVPELCDAFKVRYILIFCPDLLSLLNCNNYLDICTSHKTLVKVALVARCLMVHVHLPEPLLLDMQYLDGCLFVMLVGRQTHMVGPQAGAPLYLMPTLTSTMNHGYGIHLDTLPLMNSLLSYLPSNSFSMGYYFFNSWEIVGIQTLHGDCFSDVNNHYGQSHLKNPLHNLALNEFIQDFIPCMVLPPCVVLTHRRPMTSSHLWIFTCNLESSVTPIRHLGEQQLSHQGWMLELWCYLSLLWRYIPDWSRTATLIVYIASGQVFPLFMNIIIHSTNLQLPYDHCSHMMQRRWHALSCMSIIGSGVRNTPCLNADISILALSNMM